MAKEKVELQFLSNAKMILGELRLMNAELHNIRHETDRMNIAHTKGAAGATKHSSAMKGLALRFVGYNLVLNQVMGAQQKLIEFVQESIKAHREFESALAEVSTILDSKTINSIYEFRTGMELLSTTFGKSAVDMAKATYQILSAAFSAENAMQLLTIATKGAVAGLTSVETSVDVLTSILNAYGQEASQAARISDYLFQTVVRGKLVYEDYASALGYITPIAANAGVAFKELAAVMSTSTRMGLHLDMTVRGLALMMQGMINPTDKVTKAAKKYGVELGALELRIFGLQHMFQQLNSASKEFGDHIIGEIVPNMRATRVAAAAAGDEGILGLAEDMDYLTNSAGATEEAMSKIVATSKFMSDQMSQMMEKIKRDFGESMTMPALEWERTLMGMKSGLLGIGESFTNMPKQGAEDIIHPLIPVSKFLINLTSGFKEGADESNEKVRESFNTTAEFIKNTMLATIAAADTTGRKSLFEGLLVEDADADKIIESVVKISNITDRIDIKQKISEQVEGLSASLAGAKAQFLAVGGGADAYADYMERVIQLQQAFLPGIERLQSELLLTENTWNEVTGALASFDGAIEDLQGNISLLQIELSTLREDVGEVGVMYDGALGIQLKFKEGVVELEDKIRALQNSMKGEDKDIHLLTDTMKAHIAAVQAQKDAYDDLSTAMSKNRLEIMKLELKGMLRRRGLLRSEQKTIKKYQIANKEITIEQLEMKLTEQDKASIQSKEILESELYALREQLRQMKDTRYEDIENLKETIVTKESEITKWTDALAAEQLKLETMTTTHVDFITALYATMTDNILAEFEKLSGYDLTGLMKNTGSDASTNGTQSPSSLPGMTLFEQLMASLGLPLPEFKRGIEYVPETQLAVIHRGEAISPAGRESPNGVSIGNVTIAVKEIADISDIEKLGALLSQAESSGLMKRGKTNFRLRMG